MSEIVAYDFRLHQSIAIASGNLMYLLMINSLKNVHTNLASSFYRAYAGGSVVNEVLAYQTKLVDAIMQQDVQRAGEIMAAMLVHGEEYLLRILPQD